MKHQPQTWHYGLAAQYWSEFHIGGPEIAYYQQFIENDGQPALDVACGTGRLLLPYLRAGLDVDGCDISADMIALCHSSASAEGFTPNLYVQGSHELDLPRRYQTIIICGSFGIGASRQQDKQALERFYDHLLPGGVLLLENHMPYAGAGTWHLWQKADRQQMSDDFWTEPEERKRAADGSEFQQRARIDEMDPLEQRMTMQLRTEQFRGEKLLAMEEGTLTTNLYFKNELQMLLAQVGFELVEIQGDFTQDAATADSDVLVFVARKLLED